MNTSEAPPSPAADPLAVLRTRAYAALLLLTAVLGVPIAIAAYYFLWFIDRVQGWVFVDLPSGLGFSDTPTWWPLVPLLFAGVVVGLVISFMPGRGGHSPADGFKAGPASEPRDLPGIFIAAIASLGLGAVVGPEAPLIAIGSGIAILAVRLVKRDSPAQTVAVVGVAGSFAAVSALLGSPLLGAFLLMEASGLGGATATVVLVPGLLAAGTGALVFIGLDSLTGLGTFSLAIPALPTFARPDGAEFGWALAIGVAAALLGSGVRHIGLFLRPHVERRLLFLSPVMGLAIAGLAIAYAEVSGKSTSDVLFSGQAALPVLVANSAAYSVGALVLLVVCKTLAYGISLSTFRGGPVFPAMFIGTAGGIALSHLPGLPLVAGIAIGIGAMTAATLRLPLTSVLLATILLGADGLTVMPLVIVAVVVAYISSSWLTPAAPAAHDVPAPRDDRASAALGSS